MTSQVCGHSALVGGSVGGVEVGRGGLVQVTTCQGQIRVVPRQLSGLWVRGETVGVIREETCVMWWVRGSLGDHCFLGDARLEGQDVTGCEPRQPAVRHTCRRGQSSREHLPLLKFRHISLPWACGGCLGPAIATLAFLAGPPEEKRGQSEEV